ncbi:uncharacterized protein LOC130990918 [Salvia miltiorrhiza]|uniref:uncharacterized protein LOC130990918 n=1 Tax=Salvia miltiorrhiza TaxID=226208 RepID=UPI0025AB6D36|nr:uncharacterized protein LOC130990918 [Salvia miltiorrhiza]
MVKHKQQLRAVLGCGAKEEVGNGKRRSESSSASIASIRGANVEVDANVEVETNFEEYVRDPGLRRPIEEFDISIRDQIRREYLSMGPCQLVGHNYPKTQFGNQLRSFQDVWYQKFVWLEYSVAKDACFCFWCYLFKPEDKSSRYKTDVFTKTGFTNWKKALIKFVEHVGDENSCHNNARIQVEAFKDQRHSVANMFRSNARELDVAYRTRLTASLDVTRFLLKQGLPFRGHDESTTSLNRGNFLELLQWYSDHNDVVSKVLGSNAPGNNQMNSPQIQKDLARACASEVTLAIINDIGDKVFTMLVDEARDVSLKEQMGVVLRYVNDKDVVDTCSHSLKDALSALFVKHGLSLSKLRGQGYDGASNMRGEFNGLKALILEENPYAMYIHCFSHQLQLIVVAVAVAKSIMAVKDFFSYVSMIVNTTGASCKRKDQLRMLEHERLVKELNDEVRMTGRGLNQETSLARPGDTRWGSHYFTLLRLCAMWPSVEKVLENIHDDTTSSEVRSTARGLLGKMNTYEFVFVMHLMKYLLGMTNELSFALQRKDQNIVQAMSLIDTVKAQLHDFRNTGWEIVCDEVNSFCEVNVISLIDMEDTITQPGYKRQSITNDHYYRVEIFTEVVDLIIQEMNNRFSEASTDLLRCMACDCLCLQQQLRNFIAFVRHHPRFSTITDLGSFAQEMVQSGNHLIFQLVYRMIELTLVLPVATASVERAFSAMKIVKSDLRNRMQDEWMNDILIVYIEKDIFSTIDNEKILQRFQSMSTRRNQLSSLSQTEISSSPSIYS